MAGSITLTNLSRYKDTNVFVGTRGPEFALFEPPPEFIQESNEYRRHRIRSNEIGFLDKLSVQYYGQGYERLWWSIALANQIIDQERDMKAGEVLVIPPRALAFQFLARAGRGTE